MLEKPDSQDSADQSHANVKAPVENLSVIICFVQKGSIDYQTKAETSESSKDCSSKSLKFSHDDSQNTTDNKTYGKNQPTQPVRCVRVEEKGEQNQCQDESDCNSNRNTKNRLEERLAEYSNDETDDNKESTEVV